MFSIAAVAYFCTSFLEHLGEAVDGGSPEASLYFLLLACVAQLVYAVHPRRGADWAMMTPFLAMLAARGAETLQMLYSKNSAK